MNRPVENLFTTRPTVTLELPLAESTRILHPEQVILNCDQHYQDVGAFCYAVRSDKRRKPRQAREVVLSSFLKQRPKQIRQLIKALSSRITDGGKQPRMSHFVCDVFRQFVDWADSNGLHDCLSGGGATRHAYLAWATETRERYRRQEFGEHGHNDRLNYTRELLEAMTGLENLQHGTRKVKHGPNPNGGSEPAAQHDFAHAVALNESLFDGLCDLVLKKLPFPYKLELPASLGWKKNHLWLFPTNIWRLPPHLWGAEREKLNVANWPYDYEHGCLATVDEIWHRYRQSSPAHQRGQAASKIRQAQSLIDAANEDSRHRIRLMLGMIAHNAFLFLFHANTGANDSPVQVIETEGAIDEEAKQQGFRTIKYRAKGKIINLEVPVTFMSSLRKFMELRQFLLDGLRFPYLFFTLGISNASPPAKLCRSNLQNPHHVLLGIDPQMPRMQSRKIRATVSDYYQRLHDASVTAKVLQNTERTVNVSYNKGTMTDHRQELGALLEAVSKAAKKQRIISIKAKTDAKPLDEGGRCESYGNPQSLADNVPVKPDCKDAQGCLFCSHRLLVASEDDARKIASAAFVMEQLILGPAHEAALRPLIQKCDEDLEKIAAFKDCREMVNRVRRDVYENGSLTPFFADKYQLFLELGVIA